MQENDDPATLLVPPAPAVDAPSLAAALTASVDGLHCRLWRTGPAWSIPARALADDFLFLPLAGGLQVETDGGREPLTPGRVALIAAGRVHAISHQPPHRRQLVFAGHAHLRNAAGLPLLPRSGTCVRSLPTGADWPALLHATAALEGADRRLAALHLAAVWRLLLSQLVLGGMALAQDGSIDARIGRALALVHGRPELGHSVTSLAAAAGLRPVRFRSLFRQACGMAPKAYLDRLRLQRARDLLRAGRPVAEVARSCGFGHPRHFQARFRAATGATAGAWRRGSAAPDL